MTGGAILVPFLLMCFQKLIFIRHLLRYFGTTGYRKKNARGNPHRFQFNNLCLISCLSFFAVFCLVNLSLRAGLPTLKIVTQFLFYVLSLSQPRWQKSLSVWIIPKRQITTALTQFRAFPFQRACNSVKPWTKNSFFIITLFIFFSRFVLSLSNFLLSFMQRLKSHVATHKKRNQTKTNCMYRFRG